MDVNFDNLVYVYILLSIFNFALFHKLIIKNLYIPTSPLRQKRK